MISYADEAKFQQDSVDKQMYITWNRQLKTTAEAFTYFKANNQYGYGYQDMATYHFEDFWGNAFNMNKAFCKGFQAGYATTYYTEVAVVSDYGPINCTFSIHQNTQLKIVVQENLPIRVLCIGATRVYYNYFFIFLKEYTPTNGVVIIPTSDFCFDRLDTTYKSTCECITNKDLASEAFSLTQKLTADGTFNLGECNSSFVEFSVGGWTSALLNKEIEVWTIPKGGTRFLLGNYKVTSDEPTADRRWRNVVAYDA